MQMLERLVATTFLEDVLRRAQMQWRDGIYTPQVVIWLMMVQRLQPKGSLSAAVQTLAENTSLPVLSAAKRVREDKISAATGGYCQARTKLPTLVAVEVADHIVEQWQHEMREERPDLPRPVFLLDGSSLQLQDQSELRASFPPARNQHGESHWPMLRLVLFHNLRSGLAQRPSWGPMYGPQTVSEQELAEQALQRLPADAVVIADRNFGIFSQAYAVADSQRDCVLRLTAERAHSVLPDLALQPGLDRAVTWRVSRYDRKRHPELPPEAQVNGRLVVAFLPSEAKKPSQGDQRIYLFTTLSLPAAELLALYGLRWNIETDLRSLKQTVRLHRLSSKSVAMMEKELLLAVSAYNLVRAVQCLAARQAGISPRQLSFSRVQDVVNAFLPAMNAATSDQEYQRHVDRLLRRAAQCRLPKRPQRRAYPRQTWGRGASFPSRQSDAAPKTK